MSFNPNYPHIILSFPYRGWRIQIEQSLYEGKMIYSAWVNHEQGCAVAVPYATSRVKAIQQAKRWVEQRQQR
jgi:hypothetical protein